MHPRTLPLVAGLTLLVAAGCTGTATSEAPPDPLSPSTSAAGPDGPGAASELAALAAAAADRRYAAEYEFTPRKGEPAVLTMELAEDGSWLFTVPGGALGGEVDVTVARTDRGYFQCGQPPAEEEEDEDDEDDEKEKKPERPPERCVHLGAADSEPPAASDPPAAQLFTEWPQVWRTRQAPLSVVRADAPEDRAAPESCFSIRAASVSVAAPTPSGTYCFEESGVLTWAESEFGAVSLRGEPRTAGERIELPADVVDADPLPLKAPKKKEKDEDED